MEFKLWPLVIGGGRGWVICDFWGMGNSFPCGCFVGNCGEKEGEIILHLKSRFSAELGWKKIVDIKEGFWHISICPTFNRKLKFKKNIFRLQLLLAEG